MNVSELHACDNCLGPIAPAFYIVRVSQAALVDDQAELPEADVLICRRCFSRTIDLSFVVARRVAQTREAAKHRACVDLPTFLKADATPPPAERGVC